MEQVNNFVQILTKLADAENLTAEEARAGMSEIMAGNVSPPGIASFLTALKMKGESAEEITAFAGVMRENMVKVKPPEDCIDTCGTGGDGKGTFNVSTCAAFVAAGAWCIVAKHGNRAASGKCGSADVLECLGVRMALNAENAERQIACTGITFMFAPAFHPAMKNVGPVRKELGFRTVFNILGPLCNPASVKRQVIGVADAQSLEKVAGSLALLGPERALVVSSETDEIGIGSDTIAIEVRGGKTNKSIIRPEDFGLKRQGIDALKVKDADESAKIILGVLSGGKGPARDIVLLNAGAAIYVSGKALSVKDGVEMAKVSIDSGEALGKLERLKSLGGYDGRHP
ncbi:Anthranilate phosphoribosyltransferase [uncultured archaeon]|nr:Anthranilate phosphoribosyltransferase [uncultured archaeon]